MANYTPQTAEVITSLPATRRQNVDSAPNGTYFSTCKASSAYNAVWFKYTPKVNEVMLSVSVIADPYPGANYDPWISIWTGTPPSLTQYTQNSGTETYCASLHGTYFNMPVVPGTDYYFQVVNGNALTPLGGFLAFSLIANPYSNVPAGSILIQDDTDGYPALVIDSNNGNILNAFNQFPAGEVTAVLPNGIICTQDGTSTSGTKTVRLLNPDLTTITTHNFSENIYAISSDFSSTFYVLTNSGSAFKLYSITSAGVVGSTVWTLTGSGTQPTSGTVNRAGTIFYYWKINQVVAIKAWDLVNNVALADLHTSFANEQPKGQGCGFVDSSGVIWVLYEYPTHTTNLRGFDAAGTVLHTFNLFSTSPDVNRWTYGIEGSQSIVTWGTNNHFNTYSLVDGSLLSSLINVTARSGEGPTANPFGNSNSCPIVVLTHSITVTTPATGTKYSGLYILTPGKLCDTVYEALDPATTVDVPLVDPFFSTALLGDE